MASSSRQGWGEGGRGLRRGRLYPLLAVSNPITRVRTSFKAQPLGIPQTLYKLQIFVDSFRL